jgi:hypothetical protein
MALASRFTSGGRVLCFAVSVPQKPRQSDGTLTVACRLPRADGELLRAVAARSGESASAIVGRLIRRYLVPDPEEEVQ